MSKLFTTYLGRRTERQEVLNIIASILDFSENEKIQVGPLLLIPSLVFVFFSNDFEEWFDGLQQFLIVT